MNDQSYTTAFTVDQTPEEVFNAINNVRAWWGRAEGSTDELGAEFTYRYKDAHRCVIKIIELTPYEKVVWHVLDNDFSFTEDGTEWQDTDIIFEIAKKDDKTELRFTHKGLVPNLECYGSCSSAWTMLIPGNLRNLITTGEWQAEEGSSVESTA